MGVAIVMNYFTKPGCVSLVVSNSQTVDISVLKLAGDGVPTCKSSLMHSVVIKINDSSYAYSLNTFTIAINVRYIKNWTSNRCETNALFHENMYLQEPK